MLNEAQAATDPKARHGLHHAPKAKAVIQIFCPGGLSHVDSWDHKPELTKRQGKPFDADGKVIEQHFATSKDGTKVPYFMVKPKGLKLDGKTPTLLYGYGGFEIALTPSYNAGAGKGWLEKGGVYVVANIRGGGEYGPRWHQGALKANRLRAYEDFAAVARDLFARLHRRARVGDPRRARLAYPAS